MNLRKMTLRNQQVLSDWRLLFLDIFPLNYFNRHQRRELARKSDEETGPGGEKRDKKKCKRARLARRRNRRAKC